MRKIASLLNKYVELAPGEPDALSALGEIQMRAGHFAEAETAFQQAGETAGKWMGFVGVAMTRFYRGDWAGGQQALGQAHSAAQRPYDRVLVGVYRSQSYLAEGKQAEALKTIAAWEKEAETQKVDPLFVRAPLDRAFMLLEAGKYQDALRQTQLGLERIDQAGTLGAFGLYFWTRTGAAAGLEEAMAK